jgi:hypothetical protein
MVGEIDENDANKASTRHTLYAKQWLVHPDFAASTYAKNIGIIYLPADVYQSKNADIAPLYLHDPQISNAFSSYYQDQLADVSGWGMLGTSGAASTTLQSTTIKIRTAATCQSAYGYAPDSKNLCHSTGSTSQIKVFYTEVSHSRCS